MERKNMILIALAVVIVILICVSGYVLTNNGVNSITNITNATAADNNTTEVIQVNDTVDNATIVGDNSPNNVTGNNTTYKVYNPQSDSYVEVIGEKFDDEVNRWYTYDTDGVRYYNTRINTN